MANPIDIPNVVKIARIMQMQDGWDEIDSIRQHHIISDICWRYGQAASYWTNLEAFTQNYIEWVKKYISHFSTDNASMWEQWGEMVRYLTLGV